jgi:3-deoxy-D-manno-octulosonate 8-phosphate phosphatase (KDO 8-P phosphatase)
MKDLFESIGGKFVSDWVLMTEKYSHIKAFVFDWDGVFNDASKNESLSSNFNEVDSMGTNLLRFSYYLKDSVLPKTALISGEKNTLSFTFSGREHFNSCYYKIADKKEAIEHFCSHHHLKPHEICYFFDDVLDLSVAQIAGIRIMIGRKSNPLFNEYVIKKGLVDYITGNRGGEFGVREACELLMGLSQAFEDVLGHRTEFSETYRRYLSVRNNEETFFYTKEGANIIKTNS